MITPEGHQNLLGSLPGSRSDAGCPDLDVDDTIHKAMHLATDRASGRCA